MGAILERKIMKPGTFEGLKDAPKTFMQLYGNQPMTKEMWEEFLKTFLLMSDQDKFTLLLYLIGARGI